MRRQHLPDIDRRAATRWPSRSPRSYREAIIAGRCPPVTAADGFREVAVATGVTRATVQEAYRRAGRERNVEAGCRATNVLPARRSGASARRRTPPPPPEQLPRRGRCGSEAMPCAPPMPKGGAGQPTSPSSHPTRRDSGRGDARGDGQGACACAVPKLLGYAHAANGIARAARAAGRRTESSPAERWSPPARTQARTGAAHVSERRRRGGADRSELHKMPGLLKRMACALCRIALGDRGVDLVVWLGGAEARTSGS